MPKGRLCAGLFAFFFWRSLQKVLLLNMAGSIKYFPAVKVRLGDYLRECLLLGTLAKPFGPRTPWRLCVLQHAPKLN